MIKIQIKSIFGKILFEYEKENNTVKDTVEEAIKEGVSLAFANLYSANLESANLESADLRSANLRSANLRSANLYSANLYSANLDSANLESANLESADLASADLRSANLRSADLRSANLRSADLRSADLKSADLKSADLPLYCKWSFGIKDGEIFIGCKTKSIEEWDEWFASSEEYSTSRHADDFKRIYACYQAAKAYLLALK